MLLLLPACVCRKDTGSGSYCARLSAAFSIYKKKSRLKSVAMGQYFLGFEPVCPQRVVFQVFLLTYVGRDPFFALHCLLMARPDIFMQRPWLGFGISGPGLAPSQHYFPSRVLPKKTSLKNSVSMAVIEPFFSAYTCVCGVDKCLRTSIVISSVAGYTEGAAGDVICEIPADWVKRRHRST